VFQELSRILNRPICKKYSSAPHEFDGWIPNTHITFEVKCDFQKLKSQNVYFELSVNGVPSEIRATKATRWIQVVPEEVTEEILTATTYVLFTNKLREAVDKWERQGVGWIHHDTVEGKQLLMIPYEKLKELMVEAGVIERSFPINIQRKMSGFDRFDLTSAT
jgi:hypothetical protein